MFSSYPFVGSSVPHFSHHNCFSYCLFSFCGIFFFLTRLCLEGFLLNFLKGRYVAAPPPLPPSWARAFPQPISQPGSPSPCQSLLPPASLAPGSPNLRSQPRSQAKDPKPRSESKVPYQDPKPRSQAKVVNKVRKKGLVRVTLGSFVLGIC